MIERETEMKTLNGSLKVRDSSFSCYLRPMEPICFSQQHLAAADSRLAAIDDSAGELSIFDAHKYFNELSSGTDHNQKVVTISSNSRVSPLANESVEQSPDRSDIYSIPHRHSSASSTTVDSGYANFRNYRTRSFRAATPTASSEASWNSQTGLLSHPPGVIAVSVRNPVHSANSDKKSRLLISRPRWIFRRKCPCSGKKSVEVRDNLKTTTPQIPPPSLQPCLSSHNQSSTSATMNLKRQEPHNHNSPDASVEKATLKLSQTSNSHENVTPNNWVDQKEPEHSPMIMSDSHKPSSPEKPLSPTTTTIPLQRVIASGRAFVDHSATGFTFPILNQHQNQPSTPSISVRLQSVYEDPPRDSLEVFRPPELMDSSFASRKSITRDNQNFTFQTSPPKSRIIDDDAASDASSDLFEIESFSTQSTSTYPMMYRHRDSLDEASSVDPTKRLGGGSTAILFGRRSLDETSSMTPTITECYEPSEASIEWSVTTAEGFDRASMTNYSVSASEVADHCELIIMKEYQRQQGEKHKRRNSSDNGLLSCRCEKAVSVGPHPVKCVPGGEGHRGVTHLPLRPHVSSRPVTENNKPPLPRSHSARRSLTFAT